MSLLGTVSRPLSVNNDSQRLQASCRMFHLASARMPTKGWTVVSLAMAGFMLSGCAEFLASLKSPQQEQTPNGAVEVVVEEGQHAEKRLEAERARRGALEANRRKLLAANRRQANANKALGDELARTRLQQLENEAELQELKERLEEAISEVVRAKAKLRSLTSRAEAASQLAEAEIAIKGLKVSGKAKDPKSARAKKLLARATKEFKKENYGGALYLSDRAKRLIREGKQHSKDRKKLKLLPGEVLFAVPVKLRTQNTSNLRDGPGKGYKVLTRLKGGVSLVGQSYKGQWVRVRANDGKIGWVFYRLVAKR